MAHISLLLCLLVLAVSAQTSSTTISPTSTSSTSTPSSKTNPNCPNKDNCNAKDGHLVVIECPLAEPDCRCVPGTEGCPDDLTLSSTQNAEGCKTFCAENLISTKKCVFYKFEKFAPAIGSKCYLMGEDQCTQQGGQCEESHGCESGVASQDDCEADPPLPSQYSCPLGVDGLDWDDYKVHWLCTDAENENVDVYGKTSAPGGTVCRTVHECKAFDVDSSGEILEYSCVLKDGFDPASPEGEWKEVGDPKPVHDEAALGDDGSLVEPSCDCDPLELDHESYTQEGLILHCTEGPVDESDSITIPSPNNCLLLCDYYSVMHVFTDWKHDDNGFEIGEKGWFYRLIGDPDDQEHNHLIVDTPTNIVRCWA